jgi:hypothetical protein
MTLPPTPPASALAGVEARGSPTAQKKIGPAEADRRKFRAAIWRCAPTGRDQLLKRTTAPAPVKRACIPQPACLGRRIHCHDRSTGRLIGGSRPMQSAGTDPLCCQTAWWCATAAVWYPAGEARARSNEDCLADSESGGGIPLEVQEAMLRQSLQVSDLRKLVPPVVSLAFGVLPFALREGNLLLAAAPDATMRALKALKPLLPTSAHVVRFDGGVMEKYLRMLNLQEGGVNLPTFATDGFLESEESVLTLREEKREEGLDTHCILPAGEIVVLDYTYVSRLSNLDDDDADVSHFAGSMDIVVRVRNGRTYVYRKEATDPDSVLLCRRQFALRGVENGFGIGGDVIARDDLPYVIHPSEIQLVGVTPQDVTVHVYDHRVTLPLGRPSTIACEYYYLDGGTRRHRRLEVRVEQAFRVAKSDLVVRDEEEFGDAEDLDRWFDVN